MSKILYGFDGPLRAPAGGAARRLAAGLLRRASRQLAELAVRLAAERQRAPARHGPELEFHAEAGAPEGALFVDGELLGYLPVKRL